METIDQTATAPARTRRRKAAEPAAPKGPGKTQQAAAPAPTKKRDPRKDRQQQKLGDVAIGKDTAGAGTSGNDAAPKPGAAAQPGATDQQGETTVSTALRGGTKQVLLEVVEAQTRGATPVELEDYPFSMLTPAEVTTEGGSEKIVGVSFFIPEEDNPKIRVATARKRHKGKTFLTRKAVKMTDEEGKALDTPISGRRIWLAPEGYVNKKG